ncbi:MAG: acyl-CoA thioesterase [Maricaulaceae bacterium]|nr:acyl-CoA thioesterase [Maricaulaceae bacterium]
MNGWDLPDPFIMRFTAAKADEDAFGHVNNARYLAWADETAWAHWDGDGIPREVCAQDDRGMAILRTEADYLGHLRAGDVFDAAVWIVMSDGRLRAQRRYQFRRAAGGATVFRALCSFVCFSLSTGRPARMTKLFSDHYRVLPSVAAALMTES